MEIHHLKTGLTAGILAIVSGALCAAVPDGYVVSVDSGAVYLDWGQATGVHPGDQFEVYRLGVVLKHPVTGEVLGQAEDMLGQGVIASVSPKFSTARMLDHQEWKAGDRTRLKVAAPQPAAPMPASTTTAAAASAPQSVWVSSTMAGEPSGLAIGDLAGDGTENVVAAFRDRVAVFAWKNGALTPVAEYKDKHAGMWAAVDVSTAGAAGPAYIFATSYSDSMSRARVSVLALTHSALKEVSHFDGFARVIPHGSQGKSLQTQDTYLARELRLSAPQGVTMMNGKAHVDGRVPLPKSLPGAQLFGYAWADLDGDGADDWITLEHGTHLHVNFKTKTWTDDTLYGGTKDVLASSRSQDETLVVDPRLETLRDRSGRTLLLVPYNESNTIVSFARLKSYRNGELTALGWNGTELVKQWQIPSSDYIADYAVNAQGTRVWLFTEPSSDHGRLSVYSVP